MLRAIVVAVASTLSPVATADELHADTDGQAPMTPVRGLIEDARNLVVETVEAGEENAMSLFGSLVASLDVLLPELGFPVSSVVCAVLVITVLTFIFIQKSGGVGSGRGSAKRKGVLVLGPCGSGKTAMMLKLCHDRIVPTVTSMQSSRYVFRLDRSVPNSPSTTLVDYPGHERLRGSISEELRTAERVVFVLDGSCLAAQVAAGAELLYDVLSDVSMEGSRGLLIALNKSDLKEAKPAKARTLLQKELEKLRSTRGTLSTQGEEDDLPTSLLLGRPGQPFNLEIDSPCEVTFGTCSVKDGTLDSVSSFVGASVS